MEVHVLDDYYLAITLLVTVAYQLAFFAVAFSCKFDKLTDFAGGTNFVLLAVLTLALSGQPSARQVVASVAIMLWGARLSGFLLFRILKTGKDDRFDDKRDRFFPFLGFWVFQMIWVWAVSLPVTLLNSPAVAGRPQPAYGAPSDIAGVVLWVVGMVLESVADAQKYSFRANPANRGRACDAGVFAWSRHPNYFAEMLLQFGIYAACVAPAARGALPQGATAALYASVVGPLLLVALLMFVSGVPLAERPSAKRRWEKGGEVWEHWVRYARRTSILIPLPPQLYEKVPTALKRTLLLEFPMYVFDPEKHADPSKAPGRGGEAEREGSTEGINRTQEA